MWRCVTVAGLLALAGCGGDSARTTEPPRATPGRACTEIGCNDQAEVRLARAPRGRLQVTLCADRSCQTVDGRGAAVASVRVPLAGSAGDTVRVAVTVRRGGRVVARAVERLPVRTERPNGPGCPPVCRFVSARLDVASESLELV